MADTLKTHFPMIREREELLSEIQKNKILSELYEQMSSEFQEEFLNFCTGMAGAKILRDSFFKEVLNPEYAPERLENLLSILLERRVKILNVLPNDSTRISDESSLLITDIIVELEDGSLANVEIQKIGYAFPGPRGACYSADMLLRQYRRVRARKGKHFAYNQIKNVYLIAIFEKSPKEFKKFPDIFYHHAKQIFDSGLELDLLQEYIMIPLDIYHKRMDNKPIETTLEAWLTFLLDDRPEKIIELITKYPEFKPMYETLYQMCLNVERVINMFFSEELRILDRNTVRYMMDEQQKEIEEQKEILLKQKREIHEQEERINSQKERINSQQETISSQEETISSQEEKISSQEEKISSQEEKISSQEEKISSQEEKISSQEEKISSQEEKISSQEEKISSQEEKISSQEEKISSQKEKISSQEEKLNAQEEEIAKLKEELESLKRNR